MDKSKTIDLSILENTIKISTDLKTSEIPESAGVYLFRNKHTKILYVGKASDLRSRISQYISFHDKRISIPFLMEEAFDIKIIPTSSSTEALLLEEKLIKRHRPKYNVDLKEGTRYPYLAITKEKFPSLIITRRPSGKYRFLCGPFTEVTPLRKLINVIQLVHPIKKCQKKTAERPCINNQMNLCPAPCCNLISVSEYEKKIRSIIKLLKGKNWHDFSVKIEQEIKNASNSLLFEKAAELRDSLKTLPMLKKEAKTRLGAKTATDYFLFNFTKETGFLTVISKYNNGIKDIYSFNFSSTGNEKIITAAKAASSFYDTKNFPAAIFAAIKDSEITSEMLSAMNNIDKIKKVKPSIDMINLLETNQNQNIDSFLKNKTAIENQLSLFNSLFSKPINSILCIDISTLYGELTVAGAIWWEKGVFLKRNYRRFRIKRKGIDDFDSIRQTVKRLEKKWLEKLWEKPDLLLIDGGIGQVNIVSQLFSGNTPVLYAGISKDRDDVKGHETLVLPDGKQIALTDTPSSLLIKRIRDEAHRFSISWNRKLRKKKSESILSTIHGIGKKREEQLIRYFGSVKNIKSASIKEISSVPAISETLAKIIKKAVKF